MLRTRCGRPSCFLCYPPRSVHSFEPQYPLSVSYLIMGFVTWSTKQHFITSEEVEAIENAIFKAKPLKFDDWKRPANAACDLTDADIQATIDAGNVAYSGLDWISCGGHYTRLVEGGVNWIPFLRARSALTLCNFASERKELAPIFDAVLETYQQCPAESASYLAMALLKLRDRLFSQALQWLHFATLATQCSKNVLQEVSEVVNFNIKECTCLFLRNKISQPPRPDPHLTVFPSHVPR